MEIKGQKILLRDFIKEDIEDRIRWGNYRDRMARMGCSMGNGRRTF